MSSCPCDTQWVSVGLDFGATKCDKHNPGFDLFDIPPIPTVLPIDPVTRRVRIPKPTDVSNEDTEELKYFKFGLMPKNQWAKSYSDDFMAFLETSLRVNISGSIKQVVAAFLKVLWAKVKLPAIPLSRIKVVISWPRCWSNHVLEQLMGAVKLASEEIPALKSARYIPEHEAARRSVLYDMRVDLAPLLQAGHCVLIVDCGGMTVVSLPSLV
ncbi:hypothetical protein AUP68_15836 [Ilyonectria robusta]